jgi:hypothetical protein
MRSLPALLAVVLLAPALAAATPAGPAATRDASQAGAELRQLLELASEASPYDSWPGRARSTCSTLRSEGYWGRYDELWCTECVLDLGGWVGRFRFHPDLAAGTCTLQQVQLELTDGRHDEMEALEAVVAAVLGRAERVVGATGERGSGSWLSTRRWSRQGDLAYLHADEGRLDSLLTPIGFLWRRAPLLKLDDADPDDVPRRDDAAWDDLAVAACRDAGLGDCDTAKDALSKRDQALFVRSFHGALARLEQVPRDSPRWAPLAYWLDFMAGDEYGLMFSGNAAEQERLAALGIEYDEGYDSLLLKAPWLQDAAANAANPKWAEQAFLKLIRKRGTGAEETELFRKVITLAGAWLRDHPKASIAEDIQLELALANETWWSLSQADPGTESEEALAAWSEGADAARRRALELYRRLKPRDSAEKVWLEQRIFRLERRLDTSQRSHDDRGC